MTWAIFYFRPDGEDYPPIAVGVSDVRLQAEVDAERKARTWVSKYNRKAKPVDYLGVSDLRVFVTTVAELQAAQDAALKET